MKDKNTKKRDRFDRDIVCFIAHKRKSLGLSVSELADRVGISSGSISGFENNKYIPNVRTAALICEALNCKFEDIFYLAPKNIKRVHGNGVLFELGYAPGDWFEGRYLSGVVLPDGSLEVYKDSSVSE